MNWPLWPLVLTDCEIRAWVSLIARFMGPIRGPYRADRTQVGPMLAPWTLITHLPLDKMTAFSQRIFSDTFSWMKSFVVWLKFYWSLFLRVKLTITSIGSENGLAPNRRQAIIWTNTDLIHWRIYVALGGDELIQNHLALSKRYSFTKLCLKRVPWYWDDISSRV